MICVTVLARLRMAVPLASATWLPCSASRCAVCASAAVNCTWLATSPMEAAIWFIAVALRSVSARCSRNAASVLRDNCPASRAATAICPARSLSRVKAVFRRASSLISISCNCPAAPDRSL
ncbi:hypothetical protein D3C71_1662220 [compost metagenome]